MGVLAGRRIFLGNERGGDGALEPLAVDLEELRNHVLITGLPASGKTNTGFHLLQQLNQSEVPTLIIEPQRTEYRQPFLDIKGTAGSSLIFSLGDESVAPLRFNPLEILPGINVLAHIEAVRSALTICFELSKESSQLLEKVLYELYALHGWNLFGNTNHRVRTNVDPNTYVYPGEMHPTFDGLVECLNAMTLPRHWSSSYRDELNQTLDTLLSGGKGLMLNTRKSTPASLIFDQSALLELQALGGIKERSFVLAMLLVFLREYRQSHQVDNRLKHALIIDDAMYFRNIMGFAKQRIIDVDRSEKQIVFASMLRELSSLGEAVIVSLPLMGNLRPDFVHNFSIKVAHRLSPEHGAEIFRQPMFLSEDQYAQSSELASGTALISGREWTASKKVEVPEFISLSTVVPQSVPESNYEIKTVAARSSQAGDLTQLMPCTGCRFSNGGCNASTYDLARRISLDLEFQQAYSKYLLSVESDLTKLVAARASIVQTVQSIAGSALKRASVIEVTWCSLCQATERYFDSLGNEHHIDFETLQELKKEWLEILNMAFTRRKDGAPQRLSITVLQDFKKKLESNKTRDQGPFPTCARCTSKCFYQVDVGRILRDEKMHFDFNHAIVAETKKQKAYHSTAWFCMLQCERMIGQRNVDLAYCLAVHFLNNQKMSDDAQTVLLHHTRKEMERIMTRPNLKLAPKLEQLEQDDDE